MDQEVLFPVDAWVFFCLLPPEPPRHEAKTAKASTVQGAERRSRRLALDGAQTERYTAQCGWCRREAGRLASVGESRSAFGKSGVTV